MVRRRARHADSLTAQVSGVLFGQWVSGRRARVSGGYDDQRPGPGGGDDREYAGDPQPAPERPAGRERRRWLVPALVGAAAVLGVLLLAGIASLLAGRGDDAAAVPTATLTVAAGGGTPGATGTRPAGQAATTTSAAPTAPMTVAPTPSPVANRAFIISGTGGDGVRLRAAPGGDPIDVYQEGARLVQIGPDREVAGVLWRNVRTPDNVEGWVAAEFTQPAP